VDLLCFRLSTAELTQIAAVSPTEILERVRIEAQRANAALEKAPPKVVVSERAFTDDELSQLARGMAKFPGGVRDRWQHIARLLPSRTEAEIVRKARLLSAEQNLKKLREKENFKSDYANSVLKTKKTRALDDDNDGDHGDDGDDEHDSDSHDDNERGTEHNDNADDTAHNAASGGDNADNAQLRNVSNTTATRAADATTLSTTSMSGPTAVAPSAASTTPVWSPRDQSRLEEALTMYDVTVNERWTLIAKHVGRTRKDCVDRYRYCANLAKQSAPK